MNCPYHKPILELQPIRSCTLGLLPMTKYISTPTSDVPFGVLPNTTVGTAATCGCNCGESTQSQTDDLAQEIEAMLSEETVDTSGGATQP
jgi:hypothetical protein